MSSQPWPRLRFGPALEEAIFVGALLLGALTAVVLIAVAIRHVTAGGWPRLHGQLRWRVRRRTVRAFAQAVSCGDAERAEANAKWLLDSSQRSRRPTRGHIRSWDESAVRIGDWRVVSAEFRTADGLATWCPTLSSTTTGDVQIAALGRARTLNLTILSRTWPSAGCETVTADIDGAVIRAQVLLRPLTHRCRDESVELWVHLEGPSSRRTMRTIRRVTRRAVKRWAAQRSPPSAQRGWAGESRSWLGRHPTGGLQSPDERGQEETLAEPLAPLTHSRSDSDSDADLDLGHRTLEDRQDTDATAPPPTGIAPSPTHTNRRRSRIWCPHLLRDRVLFHDGSEHCLWCGEVVEQGFR